VRGRNWKGSDRHAEVKGLRGSIEKVKFSIKSCQQFPWFFVMIFETD
jgi:hypothetical protein